MRVRVGEFDIDHPKPIFGVSRHQAARILIRRGAQPVGFVWLPNDAGAEVFSEAMITAAVEAQLGQPELPPLVDPAEWPQISVVVCTRDRPLTLRVCLKSLSELDYPQHKYEVIVVDNASEDLATHKIAMESGVRYLREDTPGLDNARNCGARNANHGIIAYTDDDVCVDRGWLKGVARGFAHGDAACVTGLICPLELETPAQLLFEQYGGMGKGMQPKLIDPANLSPSQLLAAYNAGVGANMAYRRGTLLEMGGFDPDLDVGTPSGGAGDLDMFHRLLVAGQRVRYEPSAFVWHRHRREIAGLRKQIYNNGRSFGCYLIKSLTHRTAARSEVARFAFKDWIGSWLLGSLFSRQPGRNLSLVLAESWGAMHAPWAYLKTYRKLPWSRRS